MRTEQRMEEQRVFYGIGGAGNFRRPSEMVYLSSRGSSLLSRNSSKGEGRRGSLAKILNSLLGRNGEATNQTR
ncbi:hypothetical protein GJ744_004729 [Endocarpon pusillum]|uniref:Uncharacterized protein n=1 Tax=Endocarpon pusillum TaxID=364733 RepID=A0A8H7DYS9_9EURO|nr:hypothetical protein GJ744_004729 [Endocarpon pusillum]